MAEDTANTVSYYLSVKASRKDDLGVIRHWNNVKIAFEGEMIWLKGFTSEQFNAVAVKCIPEKNRYYQQGAKLFLMDSLLPDRNVPSVLWSAIDRGLPMQLPGLNPNFFGIDEKMCNRIVPSSIEHEAFAMVIPLQVLATYVGSAPSVRLSRISWVIIKPNIALLLGTPLLPVTAEVYWRKQDFILPAGFDMEFPLLADTLSRLINPDGENWIVWNKDSSYFVVKKDQLRTLSLGSFRRSVERLEENRGV